MWEIISATILCLFAIFGFVAFVKALIFKIYKPKNESEYLIIDFKGKPEDVEYTLRSRLSHARWIGKSAPENIIIIDKGLSAEERKICNLICNETEIIKICTPAELYKFLEK